MKRSFFNPRFSNNFLDTCAFDPAEPEAKYSEIILGLYHQNEVSLILSHTNQKEIEHPNTPVKVKQQAGNIIYSLSVELNPQEKELLSYIHILLTGNALPPAHYADATHIFESIKYCGSFITTDNRILSKRADLEKLGAKILKPSEWINCYNSS
jgi:hypothetical protein